MRRGSSAEAQIWERYGTRGAAFVSDMCSFSRTTRAHGICHFLGLIEHARRIIAPEILRHDGKLLKFEIDNCFAFFATSTPPCTAHGTSTRRSPKRTTSPRPRTRSRSRSASTMATCCWSTGRDFFGDPVNTACKLGEDVAAEGETLVTARAFAFCKRDLAYVLDRKLARISGIDIEYARISFMHARGRR